MSALGASSYDPCLGSARKLSTANASDPHNMSNNYQQQLLERLERLPDAGAPAPWHIVGGSSIGGLTAVGFADNSDDLLVVSHQGRGLFDCLTGERLARDLEVFFENADDSKLTAPGIGRQENTIFRMAGLHGSGLMTSTRDGWGIHVVHLPWPTHVFFLTSNYKGLHDDIGHITKLCNDEPCTYRAAGFSPTGRSLVIATSCDLIIFGREMAQPIV